MWILDNLLFLIAMSKQQFTEFIIANEVLQY